MVRDLKYITGSFIKDVSENPKANSEVGKRRQNERTNIVNDNRKLNDLLGENEKGVLVLVALIGVALAAPQGNDNSRVMETPKFNTLAQEKIVELYEFLKSQLEDKNEIVVFFTLLALSFATPKKMKCPNDGDPRIRSHQAKIVELYEFLSRTRRR
ncbi:hypothetical protein TCAL_16710 [Tigriopus californicus]|uniref:Uncharacterized protein n=1 Tax=Tigriopus californicus TaxID=6832 RepID=A0A553PM67_TIGCA|nr:hypothetical protein TCAL_16710 [Tigriopus californicus]